MLRLSLLAAALAAIAQADQKTYTSEVCITKHRPAQYAPTSIPTSTRTSSQTVCYTTTTCGTATTTTTITPEPVSFTKGMSGNVLKVRAAITVFAAAKEVTCSTTTTISTGASTLYTGEYSGRASKRTAAALDSRAPFGQPRSPLLGKIFHRYGQKAFNANQKPFAVDCLAQVTTYDIATSTISDVTTTETVNASTPTIYITLQNNAVDSEPIPITTTITAQPTEDVITGGVCTVTVASSTTTQHLKCAPTNLISEVDGYGIGETQGDSKNTRGLAPGGDPSACCQLCIDTEDCAASEDDPDAGNCFLWYTTPPCGLGFKYAAGSRKLKAGTGFLLQTGCGTIEETESGG